ncbi:MAG: putative toxin-antitoxin system toxin component, PIN family [Deltaproteobacteria bacterium]|nr:putative toxin-antitoxin system toxin component, PIN family [Deltaproteobacteria bacterium]
MRVCLDTNVLVAAFATRGLCADVFRTVLTEHDLVLGEVILVELRRALRGKLKLSEDRLALVEAVLGNVPVVPTPVRPDPIKLRDPSDGWIIATALDSAADVIVTGDRDLLDVRDAAPLPIVDPRSFWEMLRSRGT